MAVRVRMDPREDISNRADFTYDLIQSISKKAQESVDTSPDLAELKKKAKVAVAVHGTLKSISVEISITVNNDQEIAEAELEAARKAVAEHVNSQIKSAMSDMIGSAMGAAHKRTNV